MIAIRNLTSGVVAAACLLALPSLGQDIDPRIKERAGAEFAHAKELIKQRQFEAAEGVLKLVIDLYDEAGRSVVAPHYLLGELYLMQGRYSDAYHEIAPFYRQGRFARVDLLLALAASRLHPVNTRMASMGFLAAAKIREPFISSRIGSVSYLPKSATPYEQEAAILTMLGMYEDELFGRQLVYLEQALERAPTSPVARYLIGDYYVSQGKKDLAVPYLREALRDAPPKLLPLVRKRLDEALVASPAA